MNLTWDVPAKLREKTKIPIGSREYMILFSQVIIPVIKEFDPQLIVVCCGFDACEGDPLGEFSVEP